MSRPWPLTPKGQKTLLWAGFLISLALVLPASWVISQEQSRAEVQQLIPGQVSYCELARCGVVSPLSIEVLPELLAVTETEFGVRFKIQVVNQELLQGDREVWAELRSPAGERIESLRGLMRLSSKGPQFIEFFFTGTAVELTENKLFLGF
ncbi:MAG: hypothetical protein VW952_01315 [Aquiluna sp.]